MARTSETVRWAAAILAMAAAMGAAAQPASTVLQQTGSGEESAPDTSKPDDQKTDDQKPEKKDAGDIRNAIGDLSLVRGMKAMAKPQKKGTWSEIVNQPYYTPQMKAEKLLFHGQYDEAEAGYKDLLEKDPANQKYLEGYVEAILQQGHVQDWKRFDAKVAALNDTQRGTPRMVRLRAQAMLLRGDVSPARQLLKEFADAHKQLKPVDGEVLTTLMLYGKMLEDEAEYPAAAGLYARVAELAVGQMPEDSQAATQIALAIHRESVLNATGRERHQSVLVYLGRITEANETYWPAKLVEARVLLESHNVQDGGKVLDEVLDLNPNALEARFLGIDYAIEGYQFEAAQSQIADVKERSDLPVGLAYEGRLLLKERLPQQAIVSLEKAIAKDPAMAKARGWLAGAYFLTNQREKYQEQLTAIHTGEHGDGGPSPVTLYEAGEILRDARQFAEAEKLYLQAESEAQWWSDPAAALGSLYLETGQEDKARTAYDRSFKIDPYNMRAFNQLKLLDYLQQFAEMPSRTRLKPGSDQPAFVIRYSKQDEVLAKLAVDWMEKQRPEILSYFQITELPATTQIELFPSHEQFGVRTTGLPWIGTVGACTGNVIAMDVPRGGARDMMGTFDWARVLRHEFTHTVTLALTNNRIPHWLTEAAACEQEQAPRDWENCQLLASNYRAETLFKIADLNWGFIRPKRSVDRQLAYMESQWLYEYLVEAYGLPKMLEFMRAFHDGAYEAQAWEKTYGKSMADMDKEFHAWCGKQIESWGLPTDPLPKRAELEAAIKKDPGDVDSMVKLAWMMGSMGDVAGARKQLETALEKDPKNIRARELLGAVLSNNKEKGRDPAADQTKAKELLESVQADAPDRPVTLRTLGVMAMARAREHTEDANRFDDAEKWFKRLEQVRPLEDTSYSNLAGIYLVKGDTKKAIAQLLEMQRHEQKDERIPRKLADLYRDDHQLKNAEESAYRAVRINPYNAINQELLAQVLMEEKEYGRAMEYWQQATQLQPKVVEFWEGLADAAGMAGDLKMAHDAAEKAVALQPASAAKKWMQ